AGAREPDGQRDADHHEAGGRRIHGRHCTDRRARPGRAEPLEEPIMSLTRRSFLTTSAAALGAAALGPATLRGAALTPRQRVERALAGRDVDRPPISLWHHFGLEKDGPQRHAQATLAFHKAYETDLVKVMSDFPYPRPAGEWFALRETDDPFPEQIRALQAIRD